MEERNQPLTFLKADTPEELRFLMIINNSTHKRRFYYQNPVVGPDKKWYTWYEMSLEKEKREIANGDQ